MKIIEAEKGDSIYIACQKAAMESKNIRGMVSLNFNDISIIISPFSDPDDSATIYNLKHKIKQLERPIDYQN
jgi:hypothetical protein